MSSNTRLLKRGAMAVAAVALGVAASAAPAMAQPVERCADLYSGVIALYQTAPFSAEYTRASAFYAGRCLTNSAAGPAAVPPYRTPSEQQPVAVFSGQVVVDGVRRSDDGDPDDGGPDDGGPKFSKFR